MKIKGISIWEQHVERIVLGVAGLVFLSFTVLQFIGDPNAMKVGGETYSPGDVNERLETQAEQIVTRLAPTAGSPVKIDEPDTVFDRFREEIGAGVSPDETLVATLHPVNIIGGSDPIGPALKPYVVPQLPAPDTLVHRQYFDALVPEVVTNYAELQPRFPEEPYDLTWVTPAAMFDLSQVNEQLRQPGPDGELVIPTKWYNNRLPILSVKVEREELVDGVWTNQTMLDPIPGQWSLDAVIDGPIDALARKSILDVVSDQVVQGDIVQPEFYVTRNASWSPPDPDEEELIIDEDELDDDEALRIGNLRRRLAKLKSRRDALWKKLNEIGGPLDELPEDDKKKDGGRGSSGGGDDGLMGGGGDQGGLKDPSGSKKDENLKERYRLTKIFRRVEQQVQDLETELARLTDVPLDDEITEDQPGLLDADRLLIWAHDLDVTPGGTYRYRFTVEMFNPLFARKLNLVDEQMHLAENIRLESPPSEWSVPLRAEGMLRVFVTRATAANDSRRRVTSGRDPGGGTAEVFRFHDGRWWSTLR